MFAGGGSITIGYACGDIIYPSAAACSQSCAEGHCAPFTVDVGSWGTSTIITWDGISVSGDSGLDGELKFGQSRKLLQRHMVLDLDIHLIN